MEDLLINPNIAYIILVTAFLLAGLAILTPGTGILEIATIFLLLVGGWELYNLPTNDWALLIILAGFVLYLLAVRKDANRLLLGLSVLAVVAGSWFLFRSTTPTTPALNPYLFILVTILASGFLWVVTVKVVASRTARPRHDLGELIGATGESRTLVHADGSVQVASELWSARSNEPIPADTPVRVVGRDGFILLVEAIDEQKPSN